MHLNQRRPAVSLDHKVTGLFSERFQLRHPHDLRKLQDVFPSGKPMPESTFPSLPSQHRSRIHVQKQLAQSPPSRPRTPPEKKIGPFSGGIGVAIWLNTADTDDGPKQFRPITIAPRRYLDRETGEWKDVGSFLTLLFSM